jgi:hypothetical protein
MKANRLTVPGLVMAAAVLAGCASGQPARERSFDDRVCVRVRHINSFDALDDRHVLVRAGASENYLFTVERSCSGLRFANAITIADATSRVCSDGFGYLSFPDQVRRGARRCLIIKIERVEDRKDALRRIEAPPED